MTADLPFEHPQSPRFGTGTTRRRVRLTGSPGMVFAELEDHAHAMRLRLHHRDGRITAIEPDFQRFPMAGCFGAAEPLKAVIGAPIGQDAASFFAGGIARRNCTHMLDLAWLASRHAPRGAVQRLYAIDIPDALDGRQEITAHCDGIEVLRLSVLNGAVEAPPRFAGRHLFGGFVSWLAGATWLSEEELEAAMIAQKVSLIVPARRYRIPPGPVSAAEAKAVGAVCYSYAPERVAQAVRLADARRDFSDEPERLLRFL